MFWRSLILALSIVGESAALGRRDKADGAPEGSNATPEVKRFIVELAQGSNHETLKQQINARPGTKILRTFDSEVFSGISVESNTDNVDTLSALGAVSQAWSSRKILMSPFKPTQTWATDAEARMYSLHNMTGVDKAHMHGYFGKGAVVAVVDTGVDWSHPALGGGFGPGYKIAGGWDYVGDSKWPTQGYSKQPDSDPMDYLGHGTHVTGIIAGKSREFIGVAPEATILSYKVFGTVDGTDEDTLIEAFLTAFKAGADIITASVGAAGGWDNDAWALVASRLVSMGVVVTIAAGNEGIGGPFFAGIGATGNNVLAVASVEASTYPVPPFLATFTTDGVSNTIKIAYFPGWAPFPASFQDMPIVPFSDSTIDPCKPLEAPKGKNLSELIVLVPRGNCLWPAQQKNLEAAGAKQILFYQDDRPIDKPYSWYYTSYLGLVDAGAAAAIIKTTKAGGHVTGNFSLDPYRGYVGMYNSAGGRPNSFSSFGGTYDLKLKPDIAAPGGNIYSTVRGGNNANGGDFGLMSGTSMATPYIAGVAALWVGKHGGRKAHGPGWAKELHGRIMGTGRSVPWGNGLDNTDFGFWAPPVQVGNGLVDAWSVLNYESTLSLARFSLNDTHHFSRYHSVEITNGGNEAVAYKFELQDAGGFEAWQRAANPEMGEADRFRSFRELKPIKIVPKVKFPSGTFTVNPGQTKKAEFSFEYPEGLSNVPVYSGKILISGSNGELLSVPYFGVASNLKKELRSQFPPDYPSPRSGIDDGGNTKDLPGIDQKSSFTFDPAVDKQDFMRMFVRYNWGSRQARWDIYEKGWRERNWKYPPVVGENGYIGSVAFFPDGETTRNFNPAINSLDDVVSFPLQNLFRTSSTLPDHEYWWLGRLANGSNISPGTYTMRFAALVPFGRPEASDNWDVYSHDVTVLAKA